MEEKKKQGRWSSILWIIYIIFIVFIGVLLFVRFVALLRRIKWRNSLDEKFPAECGSWAADSGCTRVTLEESGCVREKQIPENNSLIFDTNIDRLLNT